MQATRLIVSRGTPRITFLVWIASYLFVTTESFTSLSWHLHSSVSGYRSSQHTLIRPQKRLSSQRFGTQASKRDERMSTSTAETQTTTPVIAPWLALPLMGVGYQPTVRRWGTTARGGAGEPNPHAGIASHDSERRRDGVGEPNPHRGIVFIMGNYGTRMGWGTKSPLRERIPQ